MSRTSERRERRLEELRKQDSKSALPDLLQNRNVWLIGVLGLLALVVVVAIVAAIMANSQATAAPAPAATAVSPDGTPRASGREIVVPDQGGQHIQIGQPHVAYSSIPPTSGPHYDTSAPWQSPSDRPLPEETWVHNLEHSGVVALYNCPQGCADLVSKLEAFRNSGPKSKFGYVKLLILPYDKTRARLTLTAWNYYLELDDYDEAAMRNFFLAHQDKGPEPNTP